MSQVSVDHAVHKAAVSDPNELERLLTKNPALRDKAGWFGRQPLHVASESRNDLPENYFVFAERNGCWWAFFVLDGNNDPPVFRFDDGEEKSYRLANRSVWEFVESLVIDYEHWYGKNTYSD